MAFCQAHRGWHIQCLVRERCNEKSECVSVYPNSIFSVNSKPASHVPFRHQVNLPDGSNPLLYNRLGVPRLSRAQSVMICLPSMMPHDLNIGAFLWVRRASCNTNHTKPFPVSSATIITNHFFSQQLAPLSPRLNNPYSSQLPSSQHVLYTCGPS